MRLVCIRTTGITNYLVLQSDLADNGHLKSHYPLKNADYYKNRDVVLEKEKNHVPVFNIVDVCVRLVGDFDRG